ncbi:hypothetical protein BGZ73_007479 [Actinomortierella ambigua]|nr:hypothetical protein BGZ73_007479 [Actinomortierella ambigua]
MPGYAHYGLSPSSSPHIVSGKLPSGGSSPVMVPPVPPPRHKVTKVNRPKDFVIPATRSGSSGQDTSGSGSGGTSRRRQTIAS